jgi:hypothetical protein
LKSRETIANRKIQNNQDLRFASVSRDFNCENKTHHVYDFPPRLWHHWELDP